MSAKLAKNDAAPSGAIGRKAGGEMNLAYEAPQLRVLGTVEELTRDGLVIKIGTESDAFTALDASLTGSNVQINPPQ